MNESMGCIYGNTAVLFTIDISFHDTMSLKHGKKQHKKRGGITISTVIFGCMRIDPLSGQCLARSNFDKLRKGPH